MMARWQFPDAAAEVERLRAELEQARADRDQWQSLCFSARREQIETEATAARLQAERDNLAARLQSIQQSERGLIRVKLDAAAKMRKGEAI